jgi:predicted regulator of Ras-like GTPase activity (Roadblock/LC7/MglB family)
MHSELSNLVKKDIESIEDLEIILDFLLKKSKAKSLGFVGVGDDFNGLSLVYATNGSFDHDTFSGLISNIYQSIIQLKDVIIEEDVKYSLINFKENIIFLYYISSSIAFAGILPNKSEMGKIHLWMTKYRKKINKIFSY